MDKIRTTSSKNKTLNQAKSVDLDNNVVYDVDPSDEIRQDAAVQQAANKEKISNLNIQIKDLNEKLDITTQEYNTLKNNPPVKKVSSKKSKIFGGVFLGVGLAAAAGGIAYGIIQSKNVTPVGSFKINKQVDEGIESISFEVDGKAVETAQPGQIVKVNVKEKEDYAITSLTYNGIEIREAKTFTMPNAECNIDVKTTLNVAYITLELNGGTSEGPTVIKLPKGEYFGYADLPKVSKTNAFEGEWYLDKEMTKLLTPDTIISDSTTIYKNWFEKFTDAPNCFGVHANSESQLLAYYEAVEETNSSNAVEGLINIATLEYSTDGANWQNYPVGSALSLPQGQNIYFRAEKSLDKSAGIDKSTRLLLRGNVSLGGNILGLYDKGIGETTTVPKMGLHALFKGSIGIKTVSKDFIPATEIGQQGCQWMFQDCVNMTTAPELPAELVGSYGYMEMFKNCTNLYMGPSFIGSNKNMMGYSACNAMFSGCTSLLAASELPSVEVDEFCYQNMYNGCTSLVYASKLPASHLRTGCYQGMYNNCSSLKEIPEDMFKNQTHIAEYCMGQMFENCISLEAAVILPATNSQYYDDNTGKWVEESADNPWLKPNCYDRMFNNCKKLSKVPEGMLPAMKLAPECYAGMFQYCEALQYVPTNLLPATDLSDGVDCYQNMFYYSGLTVAPALPATKLCEYCYNGMFSFCNNLLVAPELPAEKLFGGCYMAMFYNCASLTTATVGPSDPEKRIQVQWEDESAETYYANECCYEMFHKCTSLQEVKLNYATDLYGSYFEMFLTETNSKLVLYYDGPSSYWNSYYIDLTATIKPFSEAKVFVQILPTDYVDETSTDSSSILPYRYPYYDTVVSYSTKYGVTGDSRSLGDHCRFTYAKDETIGNLLSNKIIYDNIATAKPGCYIDRYEYYDEKSGNWITADTSTTAKLSDVGSNVTLRAVFAPSKIVTCDWDELITEINKLYVPTTKEDYDTAVKTLCEHFTETNKFEPSQLSDFVGITKQIKVNGQDHDVIIVGSETDKLVTPGTSYLQQAVFTFQFQNVISDEEGYSLGTTWNGAGDDSSALDYTNSDLRKAIDGQGDGKIRWYRKSETTQTSVETYKNKSVLDMVNASVPSVVSNFKEVTKTTRKGTEDESGNISWADQNYNATLFLPNRRDMGSGYRLYSNPYYFWTTSTYVLRQIKAYNGSISTITKAQGDDESKTISNVAGLNYNQDWFYGTSYWLSSPWENDVESGYKQGHCVYIYTYDGELTYETCDKWALPVAPMFCI